MSKVTDDILIGKTKEKDQSELQKCWIKTLLNRTNSYIFKLYVA